jgi:putative transposase
LLVSVVYVLACRLLALVVLLGRGDRSKELEILVLRHELSILRRQVGRPRLAERDRLLLAALSRVAPRRCWSAFPVRPETLLGATFRIVGELRRLGIGVSATLVRTVLAHAGVPPAPQRDRLSWRAFLRQHGETILACDFFTVDSVWLRRLYVLVFLSIGSRRVEYVACTSNPDTAWITQQARNLLMDLDDRGPLPRFLIHDRDKKFPRAFDTFFASEGIRTIRTPVQAPNANAHIERWVGSARRECLDRILIVGRRQLDHVLRVYIRHHNEHRPHRALGLQAPDPISMPVAQDDPATSAAAVQRQDLLGGPIHEYDLPAAA